MSRSAIVLGASGLVGSECLRILLAENAYDRVSALVRRPLGFDHPKLTQEQIAFERLAEARTSWSVDAVFCALGTTIKKAGSQTAFRLVDHDYPLAAARCAANAGAGMFIVVSSAGADVRSPVFYSRVKGETERDLSALALGGLVILRPSLILGERSERRPGEQFAQTMLKPLMPLLRGPLQRYRPIEASVIARAMVRLSLAPIEGRTIVESERIAELGKG